LRQHRNNRRQHASVVRIGLVGWGRRHDDLCSELKLSVKVPREARSIDHATTQVRIQSQCELRHRHPTYRLVGAVRTQGHGRRWTEISARLTLARSNAAKGIGRDACAVSFRSTKLRTELVPPGKHHSIHRCLPGFIVSPQLEALNHQRLQHGPQLHQRYLATGDSVHVESIAANPTRSVCHLEGFKASTLCRAFKRKPDQGLECQVRGRKPAARADLLKPLRATRFVHLDRGGVECCGSRLARRGLTAEAFGSHHRDCEMGGDHNEYRSAEGIFLPGRNRASIALRACVAAWHLPGAHRRHRFSGAPMSSTGRRSSSSRRARLHPCTACNSPL
jgi:hypothetical protein